MTETACIFCKIARGDLPAERVFENDRFVAFKDLYPQAQVHLLVIPKVHRTSMMDLFPEGDTDHAEMLAEMFRVGIKLARTYLPSGFRSVINTLEGGGQTVFHLHLHLIGGSQLSGRFA